MDSNELFEVKKIISDETGVPIELLDGENEEENRSRALALISFRNDFIRDDSEINKEKVIGRIRKTNAEQFAEWLKSYDEKR